MQTAFAVCNNIHSPINIKAFFYHKNAMADIDDKINMYSNFRTAVLTSVMTAFGFVLALFWNDAVKSTIDIFVMKGDTLYAKYEAAVFATIIVVAFMYIMLRWYKLTDKKINELRQRRLDEIKLLEGRLSILNKKKQKPR
jgi:hypothetical protein